MQRQIQEFYISDLLSKKEQLLNWSGQYSSCSFLDNNQYASPYHRVECLVGVGAISTCTPFSNHQQAFKQYLRETNDWLFGHVSYEYGNILANTPVEKKEDNIGFEVIHFFQPEIVILLSKDKLEIQSAAISPAIIFNQINTFKAVDRSNALTTTIESIPKITKATYLDTIHQLQQHILKGDCYEINFCQEFFAKGVKINPTETYTALTNLSPNPFSCFYRLQDKYLLCASPERYLTKRGNKLISQPIKGTFKRDTTNAQKDDELKQQLYNSAKERAENVMIVDLVRNDLSKICKEASVRATELFGIYTFPQIHQMISTVEGEVDDTIDFADVLQATFPMGSMTGAPKKRVMQLINQYETAARGLYSGTVGYIAPDKNFDFNVIIRSILFNETTQYLSYQVGGGITHYSKAEAEYEECLLKADAIRTILK